jgi:hypothetical protein
MKKTLIITEDEKNRILFLHKSPIKNNYLIEEEVITNYDRTYDYKKEGDDYFFKLKNADDWTLAKGKGLESIKTKVFRNVANPESVVTPKSNTPKTENTTSSSGPSNKQEGDSFREWVNKTLPVIAQKYELSVVGPHNNRNIIDTWNHEVKSGDIVVKLGDFFRKKSKGKQQSTTNLEIMPGFSPDFRNKIDFNNLKVGDTTPRICTPNDKECAQFVSDISDDIDFVGNAWTAYGNTTKLGSTIYSAFKNIDRDKVIKIIKIWQDINNRPGNQKWEERGPNANEISNIVNELVPKDYNGPQLKAGDFVGIYYPPSKNHERAFYEGGQRWFVDGKPGNTIKKGDGWGMNTHIGRVAVVKDGVPLIFHNVDGNVKSDPPSKIRIAWVKRK